MEKSCSLKKFKFCYIMQGIPGSGKSTVAKELARETGKIFALDMLIGERKNKLVQHDKQYLQAIYDEIFDEFCAEIKKGTEIIVIDNTNLSEWEYVRFIKKAQQEHFFVSIVALPPPSEVQTACERSHFDVNDDEMTQMLSKWEPFSPAKLLDKSQSLSGSHSSSQLSPPQAHQQHQ